MCALHAVLRYAIALIGAAGRIDPHELLRGRKPASNGTALDSLPTTFSQLLNKVSATRLAELNLFQSEQSFKELYKKVNNAWEWRHASVHAREVSRLTEVPKRYFLEIVEHLSFLLTRWQVALVTAKADPARSDPKNLEGVELEVFEGPGCAHIERWRYRTIDPVCLRQGFVIALPRSRRQADRVEVLTLYPYVFAAIPGSADSKDSPYGERGTSSPAYEICLLATTDPNQPKDRHKLFAHHSGGVSEVVPWQHEQNREKPLTWEAATNERYQPDDHGRVELYPLQSRFDEAGLAQAGFTRAAPYHERIGGFGTVCKVRHRRVPDRDLAVKVLHPGFEPRRGFEFVLDFLKRRSQPGKGGLVYVFHDLTKIEPPGPYRIVMEWVDGLPLDRWAQAESDLDRRIALCERLIRAVAELHQSGIVHRDLHPQNVLVRNLGADPQPVIVDLGLFRLTAARNPSSRSSSTVLAAVGRAPFAAPEAYTPDLASTDLPRADVYALGWLCLMLIGRYTEDDLRRLDREALKRCQLDKRLAKAHGLLDELERWIDPDPKPRPVDAYEALRAFRSHRDKYGAIFSGRSVGHRFRAIDPVDGKERVWWAIDDRSGTPGLAVLAEGGDRLESGESEAWAGAAAEVRALLPPAFPVRRLRPNAELIGLRFPSNEPAASLMEVDFSNWKVVPRARLLGNLLELCLDLASAQHRVRIDLRHAVVNTKGQLWVTRPAGRYRIDPRKQLQQVVRRLLPPEAQLPPSVLAGGHSTDVSDGVTLTLRLAPEEEVNTHLRHYPQWAADRSHGWRREVDLSRLLQRVTSALLAHAGALDRQPPEPDPTAQDLLIDLRRAAALRMDVGAEQTDLLKRVEAARRRQRRRWERKRAEALEARRQEHEQRERERRAMHEQQQAGARARHEAREATKPLDQRVPYLEQPFEEIPFDEQKERERWEALHPFRWRMGNVKGEESHGIETVHVPPSEVVVRGSVRVGEVQALPHPPHDRALNLSELLSDVERYLNEPEPVELVTLPGGTLLDPRPIANRFEALRRLQSLTWLAVCRVAAANQMEWSAFYDFWRTHGSTDWKVWHEGMPHWFHEQRVSWADPSPLARAISEAVGVLEVDGTTTDPHRANQVLRKWWAALEPILRADTEDVEVARGATHSDEDDAQPHDSPRPDNELEAPPPPPWSTLWDSVYARTLTGGWTIWCHGVIPMDKRHANFGRWPGQPPAAIPIKR